MRGFRLTAGALLAAGMLMSGGASAQSYADTVWEQLQSHYDFLSGRNFTPDNYVMGKLAQGRTDSWRLHFDGGRQYVVTGACDSDCNDLDLAILDDKGNSLVSDNETDDYPVLEFRPSSSGQYTVEVEMYACDVEPCYFGFAKFRQ